MAGACFKGPSSMHSCPARDAHAAMHLPFMDAPALPLLCTCAAAHLPCKAPPALREFMHLLCKEPLALPLCTCGQHATCMHMMN